MKYLVPLWITLDTISSVKMLRVLLGNMAFGLYIRKNTQPIMIDVPVANSFVLHVFECDTLIIGSYRSPSENNLENDSLRTLFSEFCIETLD